MKQGPFLLLGIGFLSFLVCSCSTIAPSSSTLKDALGDGRQFNHGVLNYHGVETDLKIEYLNRADIPSAVFLCPIKTVSSLFESPIFSAVFSSSTESVTFTYTGDTDGGAYLRARINASGATYELHEHDNAIAAFSSFCLIMGERQATS